MQLVLVTPRRPFASANPIQWQHREFEAVKRQPDRPAILTRETGKAGDLVNEINRSVIAQEDFVRTPQDRAKFVT